MYRQIDKIAMGSPLGPTMAYIYLLAFCFQERLNLNALKDQIIVWQHIVYSIMKLRYSIKHYITLNPMQENNDAFSFLDQNSYIGVSETNLHRLIYLLRFFVKN